MGDPAVTQGASKSSTGSTMYLELLKACLTRILFMNDVQGRDVEKLVKDREIRELGWDWPDEAETMIGMVRLNCIQECVETVLREGVPGDLMEAGVWRGGAVILMLGILAVHDVLDRRVWAADSFQGLPPPDLASFTQDAAVDLSGFEELAVSLDQVKANFARYGLLDDNVRFLQGWFTDTLADARIEQLAVLRLDGDYYESTIQILEALYHKVTPGGFVIVDDYLHLESCRQAVDDFRTAFSISDKVVEVDWNSVFLRVTG
jgi:O-methyltransferase